MYVYIVGLVLGVLLIGGVDFCYGGWVGIGWLEMVIDYGVVGWCYY